MEEILRYFPIELGKQINEFKLENIEEIRIRNNNPVFLKTGQGEIKINYIIHSDMIMNILQKICDNSIYTYQNQICNRIYYS